MRPHLSIHLGPHNSNWNICQIFMTSHISVLYKKLSTMLEFCKNLCKERHILLKTPMPVFSKYLSNFDKIRTRDVHKHLMHDCELNENLHSKSQPWLMGINEFIPISFQGVKIQHKGPQHNAVEHLLVLQKSADDISYFFHRRKYNYFYVYINKLLTSVLHPHQSTTHSSLGMVWWLFLSIVTAITVTITVITSVGT